MDTEGMVDWEDMGDMAVYTETAEVFTTHYPCTETESTLADLRSVLWYILRFPILQHNHKTL